jgi:hypothetical protein
MKKAGRKMAARPRPSGAVRTAYAELRSSVVSKVLRSLRKLGPGIVTGASDDGPSGIATYSQIGAQFGFAMLWTMLSSYPLERPDLKRGRCEPSSPYAVRRFSPGARELLGSISPEMRASPTRPEQSMIFVTEITKCRHVPVALCIAPDVV